MHEYKSGLGISYSFTGYPTECPECHSIVTLKHSSHYYSDNRKKAYCLVVCPSPTCGVAFSIELYTTSNLNLDRNIYYRFTRIIAGQPKAVNFSDKLHTISPNFIKIYSEANIAEQQKLMQICGVGYRKALEFLIKDYLILLHPEKADQIKKDLLQKCIANYIDNDKVKLAASRATWLGNDETHYIRKWIDKDLQDLKQLIELTSYWIQMDFITKGLESEMPKS